MKKITTLFLLLIGLTPFLLAQQSSKSKAAKKLYEKGNKVKVTNVQSINSAQLELAPTFYQNGLVFATSAPASGKSGSTAGFDLFYAERDGRGMPITAKSFSLRVDAQMHEGPVTFSRDGNQMYFTRKDNKQLKIYEATRTVRDWNDVKELSINSDNYSNFHPTLSADGEHLYFSSNRPGGQGGTDLWRVDRMVDGWSAPVNLGPKINTAKNEVFPFIHSSGNLFFSSNGYVGAGGLDLYMASFDKVKEGLVVNLGKPFNTKSDDQGLILNPEGTSGFFTSARPGGKGKDDIYFFEAPLGVWGKTKPVEFPATISIVDGKTTHPVEGAEIRIFENKADESTQKWSELFEGILMPAKEDGTEQTFKYVLKNPALLGDATTQSDEMGQANYSFDGEREFLLIISKEGYEPKEIEHTTIRNNSINAIEVQLTKIAEGQKSGISELSQADADAKLKSGTVIVLKNINYDFNKSAIVRGPAQELDELLALLERNPELEIELSAHTDSRGSNRFNERLSNERANSAKTYLVSRGIAARRVTSVGYGENQLRNHCKDSIPCSDEAHRENRRIEVKIR